jgi:hypothetical protein
MPVAINIKNKDCTDSNDRLLFAETTKKCGFLLGKGLIDTKAEKKFLFMMNNTNSTRTITKNEMLTQANMIEEMETFKEKTFFSKKEKHLQHIVKIITELMTYGLKINKDKSEFFCKSIS